MAADEQQLRGGNSSIGVVRIGDTVRKPSTADSDRVHEYMDALRSRGVDVPEPGGRDEQGRQILEFVPGELAMAHLPMSRAELERVSRLVRRIHDASASIEFDPSWEVLLPVPNADLLCHNDLAPWNLIMGERLVFIDWDGAGPSTRLWDLAYSASAFALVDGQPVEEAAARLAAFVDGYGADDELRSRLPSTMLERARAMYVLLERSSNTGRQPWGRMFREGHGDHWRSMVRFIGHHQHEWEAAITR